MKNTFLVIVLTVLSFTSHAQTGKLRLSFEDYYFESDCFIVYLSDEADTFYVQTLTNEDILDDNEPIIDSLIPGTYLLTLLNCGDVSLDQFQSASAYVEIRSNTITTWGLGMNQLPEYTNVNVETQEEIVEARGELQAEFSYFDFRWNPDGNNPKFNFGIAGTGYTWLSFSKHLGFLLGGGFGWNLAQLQIDQQNQAAYPDKIKSNYYNYFYANYDMKFRLSLFNQQEAEVKAGNVFLDLGAQYNLPLYFAHVTRFSIQEKLVNRFIHRFSDLRLYANFGISNFEVFASCRPFDFIKEELPQFPKYNLGVKLNFPY